MKVPLRYQNTEYDCGTTSFVNALAYLYDREDSNIWARPAKMFFEEIDTKRKDNITKQKHRFELASDLSIDYTKKVNKK